jgi:hypothetical protein
MEASTVIRFGFTVLQLFYYLKSNFCNNLGANDNLGVQVYLHEFLQIN